MSDLSIYELEDIIWDDFDHSGDHIVPHPSNDKDQCDEDSCKKPRHGVTPLQSNVGNLYASGSVCQVKEERDSKTLNKKRNMREKDSWSHTPDGVFAASCDANTAEDMPSVQSDDARISNHCFKSSNATSGSELCTDDHTLNDSSAVDDRNSYNYSLTDIHQIDDLNLFSKDCDDKESSGLFYYGWPDIGTFEDMDRMLSNCDSSFGLGVTGNDDELVWFTSEDPAGGYDEALKMDLKFPCSEPSALTNIQQNHEPPESDNKRSSYMSESKDEFKLKDQKKQSKHLNQTEGKKAGNCLGNYGLKSNDIRLASNDESGRVFTPVGNWQKNKNLEHDSFGYMRSSTYLHPCYDHVPRQTTGGPMMTGIKSENKGVTSPSPKETSYASNQVHSMETSGDPLLQGTVSEVSERRNVHHSQAFQPSFSGNQKQMGMMLQASRSDLVSSQKQFRMSENQTESQSDTEGVKKGASAESGSLDVRVPQGSSISSELDEISLEATSFRQLQQVTEQLDLRTKLCIRDSLYRLARSAEQRHNYAGISDSTANDGGTGGPLMTERTNKCSGFMDMETNTNPIDRTVAHLLFHRPSDSSNMPASLPLKPNANIHASITTPSIVPEKLVCQDEAANESDDKISGTGKN